MKTNSKNSTATLIRKWKKLTGWSITIMAVLAMVAMGVFFAEASEVGEVKVQSLIESNKTNYILATFAWVLILVTDVIASVGVYKVFRFNREKLSKISALLRLIYSGFLLWGVIHLFGMNASGVETFITSWSTGLVIFGLHLILLAFLFKPNNWLIHIIQWMIVIGGAGYVIVHGIFPLVEGYGSEKTAVETIFMLPMILGEVGLALTLVIKPSLIPVALHDPATDAA